jgi:IS30 family transposase
MEFTKDVTHLTIEERRIIETGIRHGSTKTAIGKTIGKDNSTVGKEIKLHRKLKYKSSLSRECANYKHCKYGRECFPECEDFVQFTCKRRDRSPGACNGCSNYSRCRFDKYIYDPTEAEHEYRTTLVDSRSGYNLTSLEAKALGEKIQPLLKQGLSPYAILQAHPEIDLSEKTLYTYIENKVFEGLADIGPMDLRRQVNRKLSKKKANNYKKREDHRYLIGRNYKDYQVYMTENPNVSVTQMDTVYNDGMNGPFIQTYKFVCAGLLFGLIHDEKTAQEMKFGVDQLETLLGPNVFRKYVHVLLTDRGSEFTAADDMETDADGLRRTRVFYCDPMQSGQKGSLENNHIELRYVLPKECDLKQLGLVDQDALNMVLSHVNSLPVEKFGGKSPFDVVEFMYPDLYEKLIAFGLRKIPVDEINLTPSLLKVKRPNRIKKHAGGRKPKISSISPREVAQLAADGLPPKEIAARMGVSIATYYRRFPAK